MFQSQVVGVLYIDACKAFDLLDHNLLLEKMRVYRFHKDSLGWFASYLSDRKQCVKINKTIIIYLTNSSLPRVFHKDQY